MHHTQETCCLFCKQKTSNPKFCSRSCSTSYHNSIKPKRTKTNKCVDCSKKILSDRKRCSKCNSKLRQSWNDITISEIRSNAKYQKSAKIRSHARQKFLKHNPNPTCKVCGYSNHVEVCHKKPIDSFDESTPIKEVNSLTNLIGLCPNHHWEFDNGILNL